MTTTVSSVIQNPDGTTSYRSTTTGYAPGTGFAIGGGIAGFILMPYIVIGALAIGVYYIVKK